MRRREIGLVTVSSPGGARCGWPDLVFVCTERQGGRLICQEGADIFDHPPRQPRSSKVVDQPVVGNIVESPRDVKTKHAGTNLGSFAQTVRIYSVCISSAVMADRPGRAPHLCSW